MATTKLKLSLIDTGLFKLDGGAMFGVVPKRMWNKLNPADENNMCTWAMRCLLIESEDRKILVDTGIGNKQDAKFRSHFEPHGEADLITSLRIKGLSPEDITDVFLTHLHFDHSGGALSIDLSGKVVPTFPNATYWTNQSHLDYALNPNPREKASYLKENFVPILDEGMLKTIDVNPNGISEWIEGIQIQCVHGHTHTMMMLHVPYGSQKVVYCADLLPSSYHVGIPYVMSYDVQPLITMQEKTAFLQKAVEENHLLIFEHDPKYASATVHYNDRGRIVVKDYTTLEDF